MNNRTSGRVKIPANAADILKLATSILAKHVADGANSPLNVMVDFDWAKAEPLVAPCLQNHMDALNFALKSEECYRQRDVDLPAITLIVKNSAQLLKGIYAKNPKKLGDWGIAVEDSPQAKKVTIDKAA